MQKPKRLKTIRKKANHDAAVVQVMLLFAWRFVCFCPSPVSILIACVLGVLLLSGGLP